MVLPPPDRRPRMENSSGKQQAQGGWEGGEKSTHLDVEVAQFTLRERLAQCRIVHLHLHLRQRVGMSSVGHGEHGPSERASVRAFRSSTVLAQCSAAQCSDGDGGWRVVAGRESAGHATREGFAIAIAIVNIAIATMMVSARSGAA